MTPKVFGIGLSRTGTLSLTRALSTLGWKAAHYDVALRAVRVAGDRVVPDHDLISQWDALADIPMAAIYDQLDRRYPGSKFVLTVRERSAWLESCERHLARDPSRYARKHGLDLAAIWALQKQVYGETGFSRERFSAVYDRHVAGVLAYFRDRGPDLLVIDICSGAGWAPLCAFLGRPVPAAQFPHENAAGRSKTGHSGAH
jgi:hypothetical protein